MSEFSPETTAPITLPCVQQMLVYDIELIALRASALAPSSRRLTPAEHEGLCASLHTGRSQLQTRAVSELILGEKGSGRRGVCETSLPASELDLHTAASSKKAPVPTFPTHGVTTDDVIRSK